MKKLFQILFLFVFSILLNSAYAQKNKSHSKKSPAKEKSHKKIVTRYGIASFYANKFHGRKTANGEIYRSEKYTAACNVFPLNTWIKVTNLKNHKSVIVKINDRMNPKNKRLVDLSKSAAKKLGYFSRGLTRVKVEVLNNFNPETKSN